MLPIKYPRLSFEQTLALIPFAYSEEQKALWWAMYQGNVSLVIKAFAGSGKTTAMGWGMLFLPPGQTVAFVAFAKKNALDAEEKMSEIFASISIPREAFAKVECKTLNSLGFTFLKYSTWKTCRMDFDRGWKIAQEASDKFFKENFRRFGKDAAPTAVIQASEALADWAKNVSAHADQNELEEFVWSQGLMSEELDKMGIRPSDLASIAVQSLIWASERDGTFDFNDQIWGCLVNGFVRPWYDTMIVDECQDLCPTQIEFAKQALKPNGIFMAVGDDFQTIYSFRGAKFGTLDRLAEEFSAEVLSLSVSYRCSQAIARLAAELVPGFTAFVGNVEGATSFVAYEEITSKVKVQEAIVSRTNAPLVPLCLRLLAKHVPAYIEGRDVTGQLKKRITECAGKNPGIPGMLLRLESWEQASASKLLQKEQKPGQNKDKIQAIHDQAELIRTLSEGLVYVSELLKRIDELFQDSVDKKGKPLPRSKTSVVLSSTHKAKGLEWKNVFGLHWTFRRDGEQENVNLEYVCITRGKVEFTWVLPPKEDE